MTTKEIELFFPRFNEKITATLLHKINPQLCDAVWSSSPHYGLVFHTLVVGSNMCYVLPNLRPFFDYKVNKHCRKDFDIGTLFMNNPRNMLIKYGDDAKDRYSAPVAQVISNDIHKLKEIGKESWELIYNSPCINEIIVTRKGDEITRDLIIRNYEFKQFSVEEFENSTFKEIADDMIQEINKIWVTPPEELVEIHKGEVSVVNESGTYNQLFPTLFFLEGELRHIAGHAGFGVIEKILHAIHENELNIADMKMIMKFLINDSSNFVGYCGLFKFKKYFDLITANMEKSNDEDFIKIFSLLSLYANKLHEWNLQYFPWNLGSNYNYFEYHKEI